MLKNILAIVLIGLGSITAQTFSGKLNAFPVYSPKSSTVDSLRILAVMVNFAEDKDASTFGNGKFGSLYSKDYGSKILDPLPHDKNYFEAHLQFAKNYFRKVSGDRLNISFTVLPDTLSVSKTMRNYSPPGNSQDFTLLADFASEVWTKADQLNPGFDFNNYDIFLIFHAGVGRDISLPGSLGNEKDLPSVYLGENALKKIKGNDFTGFPVSGGNFLITNSMIIPETESRELSSFGSTVLFEITINGLITASIASHLGLPDLFDTKTGLSAIGRFGLMDGQAIFAYNGLFPPEPSAWEKIYLGWAEPVVLSPGNYHPVLTAKDAAAISDTVILKIPISSSEYYLVENRNRDANNNGAILTLVQNNQVVTNTFTKDTAGFYSFAVDSIDGVLTDIDEYDWSLPGLIDDTANYKGGIIIWHIDENVISSKIAQNEINTDKNYRGVDVEEADGVQDIGEKFTTVFGDEVLGEGTYEDYWYSGNPAKLFKNRFSLDTRPKSITNTGANTLITMSNFSVIGNKMSFDIAYGDSVIKPVFSTLLPSGLNIRLGTNDSREIFNYLSGTTLYKLSFSGLPISQFDNFSSFKPLSFANPLNSNTEFTIGALGSTLKIVINNTIITTKDIGELITAAPLFFTNNGIRYIGVGTAAGKVHVYGPQEPGSDTLSFQEVATATGGNKVTSIAATNEGFYFVTHDSVQNISTINHYPSGVTSQFPEFIKQIAVTHNREAKDVLIALGESNFFILTDRTVLKKISLNGSIEGFTLADLKNDGENYILYNSGKQINAVNFTGALAEGFPFSDPQGNNFTGKPLTADFEGDLKSEVISYTEDGRIFAVNGADGKTITGFPVTAGKRISASALYTINDKSSLTVIDTSGHMYGWNIGSTKGKFLWSEEYGNNFNNSFVEAALSTGFINTFFPKDKVYNYPNPVYGAETAIRYYVSENSKVNVKIFDLAGDFVAELNGDGNGGLENELVWNVTSIQSGIYLARVEASGVSGKKEQSIIKIAIVK